MLLELYCKQKHFDPPHYSCILTRFKRFIGRVCVQGVEFNTKPIDYDQELKAENAAATMALDNVKEFPISHDSSEVIAKKIYDCIGDNGIFHKYLPNVFE